MTQAAEADIALTVVMRSYNDAPLLPRTLAALRSQRGVRWKLIVFESASTDGSPAILEAFGPDRLERLAPGSYRSATVLNRGAAWADTELIAYLNSDAIMLHDRVLRQLADEILADPRCAGAFASQRPRPDASPMTRLDYHLAFAGCDQRRDGAEWLSMVCAMIRRSAWAEHAFDERLTYAEDAVWSAWMLAHGWRIRSVPDAIAEHSHEYTWGERYRRTYGDRAALALLAEQPPARTMLGGLVKPLLKRCARDAWLLTRLGRPWSAWRLPFYRWPQLLGAWHGARDGWRHWRGERKGDLQPTVQRR